MQLVAESHLPGIHGIYVLITKLLFTW